MCITQLLTESRSLHVFRYYVQKGLLSFVFAKDNLHTVASATSLPCTNSPATYPLILARQV